MASSTSHDDSAAGEKRKRVKLELASSYHIVWLDSHIGVKGEHLKMKMDFQVKLVETAAVPPLERDPAFDDILLVNSGHRTPITFVDNSNQALEVIEELSKRHRIFFITSGRLGKEIIPRIHEEELKVYRYYIFCGAMIDHVDWIMDYVDKGINIVALDFELDLLIRLARDMCREFIEEGKKLLNVGHAAMALKYFEYALSLGDKAYNLDLPKDPQKDRHRPSAEHRRILSGSNGLIVQAQQGIAN